LAILSQLIFWGSSIAITEAQAQNEATILKVAGKAEILAQGRRLPARQGQKLLPGQSVQLIGGGEVLLTSNNGKVQVRVLDNTTVKFDGDVVANSQPWDSSSRYQKTSSSSPKEAPQFSVPVGKLEFRVEPGQELRVVCPLIMAAVRGTVFVVTVDLDGTSTVNTIEGRVATYGRNGEIRLTSSGQTAQVTARKYEDHLAKKGVATSGGTWKNVPPRTQARVDNETVGNTFGDQGGGLLGSVLANPDASPTDGVNAMAIEASSSESGSIFVDSPIDGNLSGTDSDPGRGQTLTSSVSQLNPDSPLIDQGLPTLTTPNLGSGQIGHVIGTFSLPPSLINNHLFTFDLNLNTGQINNAAFNIEYEISPASTYVEARGGSGHVNLNTLAFVINNFSSSDFNDDFSGSGAEGYLGSNTRIDGTFGGALNFSQTLSGVFYPDYVITNPGSTSHLLSSYPLTGILDSKPLVSVNGEFNFSGLSGVTPHINNYYIFALDLNTGNIADAEVYLSYDRYSDSYETKFKRGTGSLSTGGSFSVSFPTGDLIHTVGGVPTSYSVTGSLNGQFNSADPGVGSQVTPGSGNAVTSGSVPPNTVTTVPILNGVATKASQ
jgi:hypothetical protein